MPSQAPWRRWLTGPVARSSTSPALILQFTMLTPDFQGLLPEPLCQPTDTGAAIYVVSVPSDLDSVIVDFSGS